MSNIKNELIGHNHEGYTPIANSIFSRMYILNPRAQNFIKFNRDANTLMIIQDNNDDFKNFTWFKGIFLQVTTIKGKIKRKYLNLKSINNNSTENQR